MSSAVVLPDTLFEIMGRTYIKYPDHLAVADSSERKTYGELENAAARLAGSLYGHGLVSGDRVLLLGPNTCEWVEVEHALARHRLVRVSVLPRLHPVEVSRIAVDSGARAAFVDHAWLDEHGTAWAPPSLRLIVSMSAGTSTANGVVAFADLAQSGAEMDPVASAPADLAAIQYTSGTTGMPKGVMWTHGSRACTLRNMLSSLPLNDASIAVHSAPISHFSGGIGSAVMAAGGANLLEDRFDPARLAERVKREKATVLPLVPTQIVMLVDHFGATDEAFNTIKFAAYAGSAISPRVAARAVPLLNGSLYQLYGSSEMSAPMTVLTPSDHIDAAAGVEDDASFANSKLASAGRVVPGCDLEIRNPNNERLGANEVGEIVGRGGNVMPGYWNAPEATAEVLESTGWMHSGDMGYLDEDGYLFLVDRKKDMVVTGGFNVFPREVENVISAMPFVADVAVTGSPDPKWGEVITALVVVRSGAVVTAHDVIDHCRRNIAGYKVPKRIDFVDSLPLTPTGKVDKRTIRDRLWDHNARRL